MAAVDRIVDYASLISAVSDYLIRSDLVAKQIPLFIQLAETEFNRSIRNRQMEKRYDAQTTGGTEFYPAPPDFLQSRNFVLKTNPRVRLEFKTPTQMELLYPDTASTGAPQSFTIYGTELRLAPVPDGIYTMEMWYYQKIEPLAISPTGTNWILDAHPDLYLYAVLLQAEAYLLDDSNLAKWVQFYSKVMDSLNTEEKSEQWNAGALTPNSDMATP